jgi:hypothetical protein
MNIKWYSLLGILILLIGCLPSNSKKDSSPKSTIFIQAPLDLSAIEKLHTTIKHAADTILQEEIGTTELIISPQEKYAIFFPKKRQAITAYYVYDMYLNGKNLLFTALDNLKASTLENVTLGSHVTFFGDLNKEMIDLVIFIGDPKKELLQLNQEVKQAVHKANKEYKLTHKVDLYDITKSEQFTFLPHLSLGHLRIKAIKELIKDKFQANKIIEIIKERIIKAISQEVSRILSTNKNISVNKLAVYDPKTRKYIKTINIDLPSKSNS